MGSNGEFFTSENDPFAGLSLISCVDEKEVIRPPQEIDDAEEEEESHDEVNAHTDMNSGAVALKLHQKDSEPRHWEAEEYEVDLDAAGPKEDLMLGDQGQGPTKHEKKMKRKAKKNCCKAGVSKSQESSYCDTAPEKELLEEALGLGLKVRKCEELVLKCCTGEKS